MRKSLYDAAIIEVIRLDRADIVTTSGPSDVDAEDVKDNLPPDTWL